MRNAYGPSGSLKFLLGVSSDLSGRFPMAGQPPEASRKGDEFVYEWKIATTPKPTTLSLRVHSQTWVPVELLVTTAIGPPVRYVYQVRTKRDGEWEAPQFAGRRETREIHPNTAIESSALGRYIATSRINVQEADPISPSERDPWLGYPGVTRSASYRDARALVSFSLPELPTEWPAPSLIHVSKQAVEPAFSEDHSWEMQSVRVLFEEGDEVWRLEMEREPVAPQYPTSMRDFVRYADKVLEVEGQKVAIMSIAGRSQTAMWEAKDSRVTFSIELKGSELTLLMQLVRDMIATRK